MRNKTRIKITHIKNHGRFHEQFCDKVLGLRYARNVGDDEVVNNTVLGILNRQLGEDFNYIKIK